MFFPPKSLQIAIDRPDKGSGYDRTIDFEAVMASNSIRKRKQEDVRIVVANELVRIRCESGTLWSVGRLNLNFQACPYGYGVAFFLF